MHYNSVDHFLTVHAARIPAVLLAAWQQVGGYYATQTPAAQQAQAEGVGQVVLATLRRGAIDQAETQAEMEGLAAQGIPLADIRHGSEGIEAGLRALVAAELADQPDLRQELERRIGHLGARVRARVTTAEMDHTLRRLTGPGTNS
ncbi:MAG TPA: hypothetical protein VKY74_14165 [Chloroflexia bacterium]|nr:hypothetical protein [Chloroflexia bacterium]